MAAPFVVMGYGAMVERLDFQVRELDVPLPGLPLDLDGLRILQLSDIHLSAFLHESDLARVIDMALDLHPHVAVVTGDLISSRGDPLDACIRQLARVKSDAGTFGCMGNHEHYAGVERYTAEAGARAGIRFLRGEAQTLRFGNSVSTWLAWTINPWPTEATICAERAPGRPRRRERAALAQSRRVSRGGPAGI